jgi:hypothetical protein
VILAFILTNWFHYFYLPAQGPWYEGNVYGNVFVVPVVVALGWLWSRTRFWPLRPIAHAVHSLHTKLDAHTKRQDEHNEWVATHIAAIHRKHVGEPAPHPHFDLPAPERIEPHTTLHLDRTEDPK